MTRFLALLVVHRLNKFEHPKDTHHPTRLTTDSHTALPLDASIFPLYYYHPSLKAAECKNSQRLLGHNKPAMKW